MTRPAIPTLLLRLGCRALLSTMRAMLVAACVYSLQFSGFAYAGSFGINPVRLDLSERQTSAVLHVQNNGDAPVTIEARNFLWAQSNGKDQMISTRDIIVTPQIFRISPGATQVLRIGALRKPDAVQEIAYRLMLEEILPPPSPDTKGVRVALRISMPVFLKPVADAKEKIDVALSMDASQQLILKLSNSGKASTHFSEILLFDEEDSGKPIAIQTASTYVLAGQERDVLLKTKYLDPDKKILIKAKTHTGPVEFHAVPVSR